MRKRLIVLVTIFFIMLFSFLKVVYSASNDLFSLSVYKVNEDEKIIYNIAPSTSVSELLFKINSGISRSR